MDVVGGNVEIFKISCEQFEYDSLEHRNVIQKLVIDKFAYAPIKKGDKLGEVMLYLDGSYIGSSDICAAEDVGLLIQKQEKKSFFQRSRCLSCGIAKSRLSPIFTLDLLPSARKAIHILHIRPERGYTRSLTNGKHLMLLLPPSSVVSGV